MCVDKQKWDKTNLGNWSYYNWIFCLNLGKTRAKIPRDQDDKVANIPNRTRDCAAEISTAAATVNLKAIVACAHSFTKIIGKGIGFWFDFKKYKISNTYSKNERDIWKKFIPKGS